jgi:hypothetical protein
VSAAANKYPEVLQQLCVPTTKVLQQLTDQKPVEPLNIVIDQVDDYAAAIKETISKISTQVSKPLADLAKCKLSTHTPQSAAVANIMHIAAVKKKVSISWILGCGFPAITLDGIERDWLDIWVAISSLKSLFLNFNQTHPFVQYCHRVTDLLGELFAITHPTITPQEDANKFLAGIFYNKKCGSGSQQSFHGWIFDLFMFNSTGGLMFTEEHRGDAFLLSKIPAICGEFPVNIVYHENKNDVIIATTQAAKVTGGMTGFYLDREINPLGLFVVNYGYSVLVRKPLKPGQFLVMDVTKDNVLDLKYEGELLIDIALKETRKSHAEASIATVKIGVVCGNRDANDSIEYLFDRPLNRCAVGCRFVFNGPTIIRCMPVSGIRFLEHELIYGSFKD